MNETLGFIGIGIMGKGQVQCLLKAGRKCVIWNRDLSKANRIKEEYPDLVTVASTAGEVIEKCEITFSMLSTIEASEAVFPSVLDSVSSGKAIVDCATLTPERMIVMRDAIVAKGGSFLEAPVSGSKVPAETGQLIFLCGGDAYLYQKIESELNIMGKAHFIFGDVGSGTKMKLVVNSIMGNMLVALGEGLALADKAGLPCDAQNGLLKVLELGVLSSPLIKLKGPKMLATDYAPHFPEKHAQKDMRFALNLGDELGVSLPVTAAANSQFIKVRSKHGDDDFAAVYEAQKST